MAENKQIQVTLKGLLSQDKVKSRFQDVLGAKANAFISSLISVANNNSMLSTANPESIMQAGIMAATLDLPVNQNLGFAYIIPYNCKNKQGTWEVQAQFQMGYKGFIQLSQRSGQFRTINVTDVREGEIKYINRESGEIEYNWLQDERNDKKIIGFVAYFELINGFKKSLYMSVETLKSHGLKYSKTYSSKKEDVKKSSLWETEFDVMASKTVLKLLLSKYAPLSIQMQNAIIADQGVVKEITPNTVDIDYVDNSADEQTKIEQVKFDKERISLINKIKVSSSIELDEIEKSGALNDYDISLDLIKERRDELKKGGKSTQAEIKLP
jgi:recombination protein RecT